MGTWPAFKAASFCSSLSTKITSCPRSAKHAPATRPTYPDPTTAICIRCSGCLARTDSTITLSVFLQRVARITHRRPGQASHRYVTTVTASAEATFCGLDADRPKFAEYRVPGSERFNSCACDILSRSNFLAQKTLPLPLTPQGHHCPQHQDVRDLKPALTHSFILIPGPPHCYVLYQ